MPLINTSSLSRFNMGFMNNQVSNLRFTQPEIKITKKPQEIGASAHISEEDESFKSFIKKCPPISKMRKFMMKEAERINNIEEDLF